MGFVIFIIMLTILVCVFIGVCVYVGITLKCPEVLKKKEKDGDYWVLSLVKIDCVCFEFLKVNSLQNLPIGRSQHNRWCATSIESLQPTIGADAPLITGF